MKKLILLSTVPIAMLVVACDGGFWDLPIPEFGPSDESGDAPDDDSGTPGPGEEDDPNAPPDPGWPPTGLIVADHTVVDQVRLDRIPDSAIELARNTLHIAYDHTSHGSQLVTGMEAMVAFKETNGGAPGLYDFNDGGTDGALDFKDYFTDLDVIPNPDGSMDLGDYPRWIWSTRHLLGWDCEVPGDYSSGTPNYNGTYNVVMWAWCGVPWWEDEVQQYLDGMDQLRADYPDVAFVYMNGHTSGYTPGTVPHLRNDQIRQHCIENGLIFYDFEDIEKHNPDGEFFGDRCVADSCNYDNVYPYDDNIYDLENPGNWAIEWQNAHTEGVDWYECESAHSQPLNANMKAYAAWWLWATLAGWTPD